LLEESRQRDELAAFSFSEFADGEVGRNPVDISREGVSPLIPVSGPVNPHESLLSQIHRAVVIVGHPVDIARNLVSITTYQLCEGVLIPGSGRFQEGVIGGRILQHVLL
jgi:hypothetical protein